MPNEAQGCMDVAGMEEVLKEVAEVGKRFTKAQADFEKAQQAEIDASDAFDEARLKRKHAADALKALADELEAKLKITEGAADDQVGVASMCSSASNFSTSAGSKDPTKRIMDRDWEEGEESYYGYSGCSDGEWDGGVEGAGYFLFERAGSKLRRIPDSVRSGALARELEEDRKEELKRLRKAAYEHKRPAKIQKVVQADVAQKDSDVAVPRIAAPAAVAQANSPPKARRQTARD